MRKSMAKVLASALSLAMAVTLVTPSNAAAASKPALAKKYGTVYTGSKAAYTVKNLKKGYTVKVSVSGTAKKAVTLSKKSIKVTAKTAKVTAKVKATAATRGKNAKITFKVYNKKKLVKTLSDTIKIGQDTTKLTLKENGFNSAESNLVTGGQYDLNVTKSPSGSTSKIYWTAKYADGTKVSINSNGTFKPTKAGVLTVTATARRSASGKATATKSKKYTVIENSNKNADKIVTTLTDPVDGYDDVVLASTKALVQAVVTNNGEPLANANVVFSVEDKQGANAISVAAATTVVTTNANGVATAVIEDNQESVTGEIGSANIKATVVGSDIDSKATVKFARLAIGGVSIAEPGKIAKSTNATELTDVRSVDPITHVAGSSKTSSLSGEWDTQYVVSNQVSDKGSTNHQVQFDSSVKMVIPAGSGKEQVSDYVKEVNNTPEAQDTYSKKSCKIEGVDAGLQYATLNFSSISLSKYTKLTIDTFAAGTTTLLKHYEMNGESTQSNWGYQLPIQNNTAIDVVVSIESKGQVQDGKNAGFVVKNVTGVYKNNSAVAGETVDLPGAYITWSKVNAVYSENKTMQNVSCAGLDIKDLVPEAALPADTSKYTYTYQVPVFPYTGDAVITEIETSTNKVNNYYLYPTCKVLDGVDKNTNVLDSLVCDIDGNTGLLTGAYGAVGFRATADEVKTTSSVGDVDTSVKNSVKVNSDVVGTTALRGDITVPGVDEKVLNATNNKLFTSVQWAPIPTATDAADNFYALAGQSVTVTAQLVDSNGNKVSVKDAAINWNVDSITAKDVAVATKETTTDVNGQAKLVVTGATRQNYIEGIKAESGTSQYKVVLLVGEKVVTVANVYWVQAGPSFTNSAYTDAGQKVTASSITALTGAKTISEKAVYVAGDTWYVGFECKGATKNTDVDGDDNIIRNGVTVSGATITTALASGSTATSTATKNGELKVTSTKSGNSLVNASMDPNCVTGNIEFIIGDTVHKNVGIGSATGINAKLTLPIYFGNNGMTATIESPEGSVIAVDNGIANEYAYVKVTDSLGNAVTDKVVEYDLKYSVSTGSNTTGTAVNVGNGYYQVPLGAGDAAESVTISASINDSTLVINPLTMNFVTTGAITTVAPDVKNVTTSKVGNNYVVTVDFTQNINLNTVKKEQFTVQAPSGTNVAVKSVTTSATSPSSVVLTLGDNVDLSKLTTGQTVVVGLKPSATVDGVQYYLIDTDGRKVTATKNKSYIPADAFAITELKEDSGKVIVKVEKNGVAYASGTNVYFVTDNVIVAGTYNTDHYEVAIGDNADQIKAGSSVTVYVNGESKSLIVSTP